MKSFIVFKSNSNQYYLYSFYHNQILLINSLLAFIISLKSENKDIGNWLNALRMKNNSNAFNGCFSKRDADICYSKYLMLKESKYFETYEDTNVSGSITPNLIELQLANLRQITLEVTDKCNLKCDYCAYGKFYEDYNERTCGFLTFNSVKTLIDFLLPLWNSNKNSSKGKPIYISFYGGEPLLNIALINNVVSYIKSKVLDYNFIKFSMTTNGMLLNKHIDFLVENNFNVIISLDGDKYNNSYRRTHLGKNSYNNIINNINLIREKYPNYFKTNINFNAVLHNRNSVEDIYLFFKNNFNKTPSIGELNNMGIKKSMIEEFKKTYQNTNASLFNSENRDELTKSIFINLPHIQSIGLFLNNYTNYFFKNYSNLFVDSRSIVRIPTGTCLPFGKKLFLTAQGNILPCEKIGHQFTLGKVTEVKVDLDFTSISSYYNLIYSRIIKSCNSCYLSQSCTQCIFNLHTINDPLISCNGYTDYNDFKVYLTSHISYLEENPYVYRKILKDITID